jgi:hypothetical protein
MVGFFFGKSLKDWAKLDDGEERKPIYLFPLKGFLPLGFPGRGFNGYRVEG